MSIDKNTLVYVCNPEWCDEGFHIEEPEPFKAFWFEGDIEEYSGEDGHLIPLEKGELLTGYRMPCMTWYVGKPLRMTYKEAADLLGFGFVEASDVKAEDA